MTALLASTTSLLAGAPDAPFTPDEYALPPAHFDQQAHADHALGLSLSDAGGRLVKKSRFGGGMFVESMLMYGGPDNFPGEMGTIEFRLGARYDGDKAGRRSPWCSEILHSR